MRTGQTIIELRKRAGLTQEQLAEKLFVSRELVSKWENGSRRPAGEYLKKLAQLLNADLSDLLTHDAELENELAGCVPEGENVLSDGFFNAFLETLNERDRSVFIRRYYFAEDFETIGSHYGISAAHARTVLARTRKKLKKYFSAYRHKEENQ